MTVHDGHAELIELLDGHRDDRLTDVQHARLIDLLAADPAARTLYARMSLMQVCLEMEAGSGEPPAIRSQLLGKSDPSSEASGQPVGHAPRDENNPTDSAREACPAPRAKKSLLDRASRRPVPPALAIAALVMISVVAWMGVTTVKTRLAESGGKSTDELQKPTKPEFVAWLMKADRTQWLDGTEPQKTRLMPGQRLAIAKGMIEIQYRTRAVVVIEGPAEFFVGSSAVGNAVPGVPQRHRGRSLQDNAANSGYLALGKLVARVVGKKADGFTINTPSGRVEDHGTEFGVEVDDVGASEFVVLSGKVDVIREASGGLPAQRMLLTKDQVAFVAAKGGQITRRANVNVNLLAAWRKQLEDALPKPTLPASGELIAAYDFEDAEHRTRDSSGNGDDATDSKVEYTHDTARNSTVAVFGEGDVLTLPRGSGGQAWTVAVWVKLANSNYFIDTRTTESSLGSDMVLGLGLNSAGRIGFWDGVDVKWNQASHAQPVTDGKWHHVAWVYDPAGTMQMYLDGRAVGERPHTVTEGMTLENGLAIGRVGGGKDPPFSGSIDEFRLYSGVLSQVQIQAVMNTGGLPSRAADEQTAVAEERQ